MGVVQERHGVLACTETPGNIIPGVGVALLWGNTVFVHEIMVELQRPATRLRVYCWPAVFIDQLTTKGPEERKLYECGRPTSAGPGPRDANSPDIDLAVTIHIFGEFLSCFCELIKVPGLQKSRWSDPCFSQEILSVKDSGNSGLVKQAIELSFI